jgi:hypothetical protein
VAARGGEEEKVRERADNCGRAGVAKELRIPSIREIQLPERVLYYLSVQLAMHSRGTTAPAPTPTPTPTPTRTPTPDTHTRQPHPTATATATATATPAPASTHACAKPRLSSRPPLRSKSHGIFVISDAEWWLVCEKKLQPTVGATTAASRLRQKLYCSKRLMFSTPSFTNNLPWLCRGTHSRYCRSKAPPATFIMPDADFCNDTLRHCIRNFVFVFYYFDEGRFLAPSLSQQQKILKN